MLSALQAPALHPRKHDDDSAGPSSRSPDSGQNEAGEIRVAHLDELDQGRFASLHLDEAPGGSYHEQSASQPIPEPDGVHPVRLEGIIERDDDDNANDDSYAARQLYDYRGIDPTAHISPSRKGKEKAATGSITREEVLAQDSLVGDSGPAQDAAQLVYRTFRSEAEDLGHIMRLIEAELSEPYNIYTFRYFLVEWPHLAFLVYPSAASTIPIGTIICKQDSHRNRTNRGYIAMLSVDKAYRRRGIASKLIRLAIDEMTRRGAHEIVLETESDNTTSLALYESLGFMREKRLQRFYSNGKDAFRLILPMPNHPYLEDESDDEAERGRWEVGAGPEWLEGLEEEEAVRKGLGGSLRPAAGKEDVGLSNGTDISRAWESDDWGRGGDVRPPTPRPKSAKPDLPPRPGRIWDDMYT